MTDKTPLARLPYGKYSPVIVFFLLLGSGILLGTLGSLHGMGYLRAGPFSTHNSFSYSFCHSVDRDDIWSDEELLWRASGVPRRAGIPVVRSPKIAFMFLTNGSLPLAPLWDKYFDGYSDLFSVYVHAPPGVVLHVPSSSNFYGRQVLSKYATAGAMSMVDAHRRLLANALLDFDNERFVLISDFCIPIARISSFYNSVINSKFSFIDSADDPDRPSRGQWNKVMKPEIRIDQWRQGTPWFEVKRKHALYIVSDVKYYKKFEESCTTECFAEEHYLPTMMTIAFPGEISNRTLTSEVWPPGGSRPVTFNPLAITDKFLDRLANDRHCALGGARHFCYFFARKFAPDTLDQLLMLSHEHLGVN